MIRAATLVLLLTFISSATAASNVPWRRSYSQAIAEAKQTAKPLFIDTFADWCFWCHELDREVYSDPAFIRYLESYIPLRIDVEKEPEGNQFAEEFRIDSLPTIIVTDSNGKTINRISGYLTAAPLMADLNMIRDLLNREQTNPADIEAVFQLANEYLSRDMFREAVERFVKILNSSQSTPKQKESAQFSIALGHYYGGQSEQALQELRTYRALYRNGHADEDALLLLSEIHLKLDENDRARAYLQEFLQKYPSSGNANRAKQIISLLDTSERRERK